MFWARARSASGVALALRVTVSRPLPAPPPLKLPITVPAKLTSLPETPIWKAPVPWLRMPRASLAVAPLSSVTVKLPPSKSVESASCTLTSASMSCGLPA